MNQQYSVNIKIRQIFPKKSPERTFARSELESHYVSLSLAAAIIWRVELVFGFSKTASE